MDYAWKQPQEAAWSRDAGDEVDPSPQLLHAAGFALGPTCSNDFNGIEHLCDRSVRELSTGDPRIEAFKTLDAFQTSEWAAYSALSAAEAQALASQANGRAASHVEVSLLAGARAVNFLEEELKLQQHYESMRAPEVATIEAAIRRLREALDQLDCESPDARTSHAGAARHGAIVLVMACSSSASLVLFLGFVGRLFIATRMS